jgi:putative hydrolase of the HAD superfamily
MSPFLVGHGGMFHMAPRLRRCQGGGRPGSALACGGGAGHPSGMTALPSSTRTPDPAAFSHVRVWIFDLDNTLYPAACNLFVQVSRRMTEFISARFDLPWEEARAMQRSLFQTHGTTLRGLMTEHDIDPVAFLDYVHDIDVSPVSPTPDLARSLSRLPGRKLIHTNGSVAHALNVLDRLGCRDRFEAIFDIVAAAYLPKPDPRAYRMLAERYGVDPAEAVMVEDMARNLVPAAAMGMTTVWVESEADWARPDRGGVGSGRHIHHVTDDLVAWLGALVRRLEPDS